MANQNQPGRQAQPDAQQAGQPPQQQEQQQQQERDAAQAQGEARGEESFDGLKDKKPEDLTPEELRLMADTMPGEGPGD
ncbi:hypothetical protein [Massilia sp.]|uniref:hypothetical protein n=1 Tax=Massilia sp. TaxID=1882437 RepID=UPI0028A8E9A0|nr:hypothetical protein [Massilia sp.]